MSIDDRCAPCQILLVIGRLSTHAAVFSPGSNVTHLSDASAQGDYTGTNFSAHVAYSAACSALPLVQLYSPLLQHRSMCTHVSRGTRSCARSAIRPAVGSR